MRDYELTFIVRSDVEEHDLTAVIERVKNLIQDNGGEVAKLELWGTRKLAYPIQRLREGQYVFMLIRLAPNALSELDRNLKLIEEIIRHLVVRVEE